MSGNLKIRVVTDTDEFAALRETWDTLLSQSNDDNLFLTWEWLFTWWKYYGENRRLNILLVEDGNKIIGIAPLMISKYQNLLKFDVLENLSITDTDKSGIILTERKEEALAALLAHLDSTMKSGLVFRMKQIPEDSEFNKLLRQEIPSLSGSVTFEEKVLTGCFYMRLPATWDEFHSSMSRKRRGNLRRSLESLERKHKVAFKSAEGGDLSPLMDELVALHQKRWQQQGLSGVFADRKTAVFYTEVAKLFSERGWLDLSFVEVDERVVSGVYGARYAKKYYYILTAFDREYAEYSVGNLHILHIIEEDAIKSGIGEFDFLTGAALYKTYWTPLARNNMQVVLVKKRFAGKIRRQAFNIVMRLDSLSQRSLRENFRLYIRKRQWQKIEENIRKGDN